MLRQNLGLCQCFSLSCVLSLALSFFCVHAISDTVYGVEAVRPFNGKPPTDTASSDDSQTSPSNNQNDADVTDSGPAFVGEPTVISADDVDSKDDRETVVISSRIYQCRDGKANVFVDEDNKSKFSDCALIRDQQVVEVAAEPIEKSIADIEHCTGMIQFKGNTYVFKGDEPCPIPAGFFKMLTPIEAQPAHYLTDPTPLDK